MIWIKTIINIYHFWNIDIEEEFANGNQSTVVNSMKSYGDVMDNNLKKRNNKSNMLTKLQLRWITLLCRTMTQDASQIQYARIHYQVVG